MNDNGKKKHEGFLTKLRTYASPFSNSSQNKNNPRHKSDTDVFSDKDLSDSSSLFGDFQTSIDRDFLTQKATLMCASVLIILIGTLVLVLAPSPYMLEKPGRAYNTLGPSFSPTSNDRYNSSDTDSKTPLISIEGKKTYPVSGHLDMTVVKLAGGPSRPVNVLETINSYINHDDTVMPEEVQYPPGLSENDYEDIDEQSKVQFSSSQDEATAAALTQLGISYKEEAFVSQISPDIKTKDGTVISSPAKNQLAVDDQILEINGEPVSSAKQTTEIIKKSQPQVDENAHETREKAKPIEVKIRKKNSGNNKNQEETVKITPKFYPAQDNFFAGFRIGIAISKKYDFPLEVKFSDTGIGGPSAGMMFSLAIIDKLTPDDMTAGAHIAGTGEITSDGKVGEIGGIKQKMIGAYNDKAQFFLAPSGNCDEVVGNIPGDLKVVKVDNLEQARSAVEKISSGKDINKLPQCGNESH